MILEVLLPRKRFERFSFLKGGEAWFVVYVVDLFSVPIVLVARRLGLRILTPDVFSILSLWSFCLGLIILYLRGAELAAALFFFSAVLDCVDGKYARSLSLQSKHGAILDAACDCAKHGFGFLLIAAWFYLEGHLVAALMVVLWSAGFCLAHMSSIGQYVAVTKSTEEQLCQPIQREKNAPLLKSPWVTFCERRGLSRYPFTTAEMAFLIIPVVSINAAYPLYPLLMGTICYGVLAVIRVISMRSPNVKDRLQAN